MVAICDSFAVAFLKRHVHEIGPSNKILEASHHKRRTGAAAWRHARYKSKVLRLRLGRP